MTLAALTLGQRFRFAAACAADAVVNLPSPVPDGYSFEIRKAFGPLMTRRPWDMPKDSPKYHSREYFFGPEAAGSSVRRPRSYLTFANPMALWLVSKDKTQGCLLLSEDVRESDPFLLSGPFRELTLGVKNEFPLYCGNCDEGDGLQIEGFSKSVAANALHNRLRLTAGVIESLRRGHGYNLVFERVTDGPERQFVTLIDEPCWLVGDMPFPFKRATFDEMVEKFPALKNTKKPSASAAANSQPSPVPQA